MEAPEQVNIEKLTHDDVLAKKLGQRDDAYEAAAEIARKMIAYGLRFGSGPQHMRSTIRRVSRGALSGMIFVGKDPGDAAVHLLRASERMSPDLNVESKDLLTWCLQGIADTASQCKAEIAELIRNRIDKEFDGKGKDFHDFWYKTRLKKWWTA